MPRGGKVRQVRRPGESKPVSPAPSNPVLNFLVGCATLLGSLGFNVGSWNLLANFIFPDTATGKIASFFIGLVMLAISSTLLTNTYTDMDAITTVDREWHPWWFRYARRYLQSLVAIVGGQAVWMGLWCILDEFIEAPSSVMRELTYMMVGAFLLIATDSWLLQAGINKDDEDEETDTKAVAERVARGRTLGWMQALPRD